MTGTIGYDDLRADTVRQVAKLMAAAHKLGLIQADHAVALPLSMTHKAIGFDRAMPGADFDTLDLPATGTQPVGIPPYNPSRWRQKPPALRHPIHRDRA